MCVNNLFFHRKEAALLKVSDITQNNLFKLPFLLKIVRYKAKLNVLIRKVAKSVKGIIAIQGERSLIALI